MKTFKELQAQVRAFNKLNKPGDIIRVRTPEGIKDWTMKAPATVAGKHTAVCWFREIPVCYSLDKCEGKPKPGKDPHE